jgi:RNA polymerase sigma-70 factor (ECF subfamily)
MVKDHNRPETPGPVPFRTGGLFVRGKDFRVRAKDCGMTRVTDNVMLMDTPDEMLATAATQGDRAAFATLVGRHYDRIHGLAWRLTGTKHEAEDLAQDICAALPSKLRNWRGEARFTTWLYRVVVNAAHDLRRRQVTRSRAADGWGDWELARQDEIAAQAEAAGWLAEAMTRLPPELRDTVALVLGEEMTQSEAGAVLGVSEGTIAWRMSEVKKRLRAMAKEDAK